MLNDKQLHYFWSVAKAGGITRAAERLHLTRQTIIERRLTHSAVVAVSEAAKQSLFVEGDPIR
jgi:hypothetical protein